MHRRVEDAIQDQDPAFLVELIFIAATARNLHDDLYEVRLHVLRID
jgi:hypothetical protein